MLKFKKNIQGEKMKEIVLRAIQKIHDQKVIQKKEPLLILDQELQEEITHLVQDSIRQLYKEKKIDIGRTINNNYIKIRTKKTPPRKRKAQIHPLKPNN